MTLQTTLFPAVTGTLFGSILFAHVVMRIFARCKEVEKIIVTIPGGDAVIESDSISATTARLQLGARYGILVAVLDMLKATVPALPFRIWQPESTAYLVAAGMATVGHIWPMFYRFKGGRGLSPVLGGLFTLDWPGTLITNILGFLSGYPSKNMLVITGGGISLKIP